MRLSVLTTTSFDPNGLSHQAVVPKAVLTQQRRQNIDSHFFPALMQLFFCTAAAPRYIHLGCRICAYQDMFRVKLDGSCKTLRAQSNVRFL